MAADGLSKQLYDKYIATGTAALATKDFLLPELSSLKSQLVGITTASLTADVNSLVSSVSAITPTVPSLPATSELDVMKCLNPEISTLLDSLAASSAPLTSYPANVVNGIIGKAVNDFSDQLWNTLGTLAEGISVKNILKFGDSLLSASIPALLQELDSIWQCINVHYPGVYPSLPTYSADIASALGLNSSYAFDYKSPDLGLTLPTQVVTNIDTVKAAADSVKANITTVEQNKTLETAMPDNLNFPTIPKVPTIPNLPTPPF